MFTHRVLKFKRMVELYAEHALNDTHTFMYYHIILRQLKDNGKSAETREYAKK